MGEHDEFRLQWRERLSSGSRQAARALSNALRDDPSRLPAIAGLCQDDHTVVRIGALRALAEAGRHHPKAVAAHAKAFVAALGAPEPDAQEAGLEGLSHTATHAREEAMLALPLMSDVLHNARRAGIREAAARCLGELGRENPTSAPQAADRLLHALGALKRAKAAQEAREILAALEIILPNLPGAERAALAPRIAPLRGHPNLQVRERAGRIARELAR